MNRMLASLAVVLSLSAVGCASDLGEECDQTGRTDECVDGGICDTQGEEKICLALCESDADCGSGEQCNGVSSSNQKACHPKD